MNPSKDDLSHYVLSDADTQAIKDLNLDGISNDDLVVGPDGRTKAEVAHAEEVKQEIQKMGFEIDAARGSNEKLFETFLDALRKAGLKDPIDTYIDKVRLSTNGSTAHDMVGTSGFLTLGPDADLESLTEFLLEIQNSRKSSNKDRLTLYPDLFDTQDKKSGAVPEAKQVNVEGWRESEAYKNFKQARSRYAELEYVAKKSLKGGTTEEEHKRIVDDRERAKSLYEQARVLVVDEMKSEYGENPDLLKEARNEFLINDQKEYLEEFRKVWGETLGDKVLEKARGLLKNKAVSWFLKQDKLTRFAITSSLVLVGGGVGYALGTLTAGGAIAYGGFGVAKRAASFGFSTAAGIWAENKKSWSVEELNKKEEEEKQLVLNDENISLAEQAQKLRSIAEYYEKERRNAKIKKAAVTIGAGAGTGLIVGLTEGLLNGNIKTGVSFEEKPKTGTTEVGVSKTQSTGPSEMEAKEEVLAKAKVENESILKDPSRALHTVEKGDSLWKILHGSLESNERFANMSEAQKTFVVNHLINEVNSDPTAFGTRSGGVIWQGDKLDFTKLFEDKKYIEGVFEKADGLDSAKQDLILENNKKISAWVEANPNTEVKVEEILSQKPKAAGIVDATSDESFKAPEGLDPMENQVFHTFSEVQKERRVFLELLQMQKMKVSTSLDKPKELDEWISYLQDSGEKIKTFYKNKDISSPEFRDFMKEFQDIIEEIKNKIPEAEEPPAVLEPLPKAKPELELVRSMSSDVDRHTNSLMASNSLENNLKYELDDLYGKKTGFFGTGPKQGGEINPEWLAVKKMPAKAVITFFTQNSISPGLDEAAVEVLGASKTHQALMERMNQMMQYVGNDIKPYENETVEQFFGRLNELAVSKHQLQSRAA